MTNYYGKGLVGASSDRRTTYKEFELGAIERGNGNKVLVYGNAASAVAAGACTINLSTGAIGSGTGYTATSAFAAGEYGCVVKDDLS